MAKKKLYTATYTFDGKRYYVRSSVSQRDADKKAAKALSAREDGIATLDENTTVTDYATRWVEIYKKETVSASVYHAYKARINNHIIPAIGPIKLKNVKPTHLQEIMNAQSGKSKTHCDKLIITIKAIFRQAVKDDLIRRDPAEDIVSPKAKDGTHRSLSPEERAQTLLTAQTHNFGLAVKLMLLCGLRPQEAMALKWSDIDQVNRRLMVRRAVKKDNTLAETKTASGARDIPIPPALWDSLNFPTDLNQWMIKNLYNERHTYTSMRGGWRRFKEASGLDCDMYDLRHTYCTDLEAAGVPINVAKYLMGHSSIAVTSRIYTHMREDTLASAADRIAKIGATVGATPDSKKGSKIAKTEDQVDSLKIVETGA